MLKGLGPRGLALSPFMTLLEEPDEDLGSGKGLSMEELQIGVAALNVELQKSKYQKW